MIEKWHWARPRSTTEPGTFEPACVEYQNDAPQAVWFVGSDFSLSPDDCEIGPEIEPMKVKP